MTMKVVVPLSLIAFSSPIDAVNRQNPISRVTELLGGLAEKVDMDMKKQEDLYEEFVCWGKSVIASKKETNAKASSRIDMLESYIADLDAGRVELTSERTDLVKEIGGLNSDLEMAKKTKETKRRRITKQQKMRWRKLERPLTMPSNFSKRPQKARCSNDISRTRCSA